MKKLKIHVTFTEGILGTATADPEIYSRFIGSKSPDAATLPEEVAALGEDAITICQRSLRAQTAQGERTALSSSEECPAGTTCEMTILCLDDAHEKAVREWLDYGALRGIGQWRNSSKGRFKWEEVK